MAEEVYAVVNGSIVTNILLFDSPTSEVLQEFTEYLNADELILLTELNVIQSPLDVGATWDGTRFIKAKPIDYPSWVLGTDYIWGPPIPYPADDKAYIWNEEAVEWEELSAPPNE